eukprot:UN08385
MCVRYMFSHNSVNFRKNTAFQFHPQMKFWIFMYKFIDFDHFQSMRGNHIFPRIMQFLLFLCTFFVYLVEGLLL